MKAQTRPLLQKESIRLKWHGYGSSLDDSRLFENEFDVTTEEYARDQMAINTRKTREYIVPILKKHVWHSVLDVGCGIGIMVASLLDEGFDAYGVDLPALVHYWEQNRYSKDRYFVVGTQSLRLPFKGDSLDMAFSLGVIEHIGTRNGHTDRAEDYHEKRRQWLREVFRVVRPGGAILIGGPNRAFPVDVAHAPDADASPIEGMLSKACGASIHRTWGEHFLCSYRDIHRYLSGLPYRMRALSTCGLLYCGRVPHLLRPAVEFYIRYLPRPLWATGFNPWVLAFIKKLSQSKLNPKDENP